MAPVKKEDFQIKSDIEVVHRPTGANISTYRYPNPDDACSTITVSFGPDDSEDHRMDIVRAAYELLRQRARGADGRHCHECKRPLVEIDESRRAPHRLHDVQHLVVG